MEPVVWPDSVLKFAKAISVAEGSDPAWNNPGDMTISLGFPTDGVVNSEHVLRFVNLVDGWHVLYHQCYLMLSGLSNVYKLTDSISQVGLKYSDGDPDWAMNVANYLGVPTSTTLARLAES